jgi:hypothetical protein
MHNTKVQSRVENMVKKEITFFEDEAIKGVKLPLV